MHHPGAVNCCECPPDLRDNCCGTLERDAPFALEPNFEVLSNEQLHHEIGIVIVVTRIEYAYDFRSIKPCEGAGFATKPLQVHGVAHSLFQGKLDGDWGVQLQVTRLPDLPHAPRPDEPHQRILLGNDLLLEERAMRMLYQNGRMLLDEAPISKLTAILRRSWSDTCGSCHCPRQSRPTPRPIGEYLAKRRRVSSATTRAWPAPKNTSRRVLSHASLTLVSQDSVLCYVWHDTPNASKGLHASAISYLEFRIPT